MMKFQEAFKQMSNDPTLKIKKSRWDRDAFVSIENGKLLLCSNNINTEPLEYSPTDLELRDCDWVIISNIKTLGQFAFEEHWIENPNAQWENIDPDGKDKWERTANKILNILKEKGEVTDK